MIKIQVGREFIENVWKLTKSYWQSEEKRKAFLLLGAIILLTLGVVYMLVQLNSWNNAFYNALQNYQSEAIFAELMRFTWLAFIYIILAVYSYYLQQVLVVNWRRWLTNRYIDEWMKNKTYYRLQMFGVGTDNPDQRISEDVRLFVEMTIKFSIGILKALCTLISFVFILWNLSGPLDFKIANINIHVEGYLVWVALAYSILGTWITHLVGRKLVGLNFVQQRYEADFRFSMMRMRENSESVAFYGGETQESGVFKKRFGLLLDNFWHIIQKQKQLVWINSGYSQIAIIFPFVVTIPRYLTKQITLGGLMQISTAFGRVQDSLSYFVDMYASIAEWQAVVDRLTGFGLHMQEVHSENPQINLQREFASDNKIIMENLEVGLPNGRVILNNVNVILKPGTNVLIKGLSGSGKSTLLRAIAGIWPYVRGKIIMPVRDDIMFIPQKPYLPLGTLREAVLYPGTQSRNNTELAILMNECHIGYLIKDLDIIADWSHVLSVGEQQRLAFVRTLIYKPNWLFLDEATSALDEETEAAMYKLVAKNLPQTTFVSVGHRSSVNKFHGLEMYLEKSTGQLSLKSNCY
ncbi:Inner membrane ABC transporter ATP-binding protein YddA [bioreactor metagenome]|uniref:Inner membrane ABC transporter ATP-binding protein YddA n=1 Tax=bioreactor metagenome TaxID=1076179 RepID=A0A644VR02_9ZZZZ|nr:ABC transporter ATP-binding protein/permease [Acidaminococcaceae bacterium]